MRLVVKSSSRQCCDTKPTSDFEEMLLGDFISVFLFFVDFDTLGKIARPFLSSKSEENPTSVHQSRPSISPFATFQENLLRMRYVSSVKVYIIDVYASKSKIEIIETRFGRMTFLPLAMNREEEKGKKKKKPQPTCICRGQRDTGYMYTPSIQILIHLVPPHNLPKFRKASERYTKTKSRLRKGHILPAHKIGTEQKKTKSIQPSTYTLPQLLLLSCTFRLLILSQSLK
jgi:hypothetical protein